MGTHGGPRSLYLMMLSVLGGKGLSEEELIFQVTEKVRMFAEARMYQAGIPSRAIAEYIGISQMQVLYDLKRMRVPRPRAGGPNEFRLAQRRGFTVDQAISGTMQQGGISSQTGLTRDGAAPIP